jgi:hypothetical protein
MTTVLQNIDRPKHQLTESVVRFMQSEASYRVYMGVHCRMRSVIYGHVYLYEAFDKDYITQQILNSYVPILEREYIKHEKGEGRTVLPSAFTQDIKQETAEILLAWLLAESAEIYKQSRLNIKYKKKTMSWL